jgi:hypothetical protein
VLAGPAEQATGVLRRLRIWATLPLLFDHQCRASAGQHDLSENLAGEGVFTGAREGHGVGGEPIATSTLDEPLT